MIRYKIKVRFFAVLLLLVLSELVFGQVGNIDLTFDVGQGITTSALVRCGTTQYDGKILLGGSYPTFNGKSKNGLVRLKSDGGIDKSFSSITELHSNIVCVSVQSDGKILIGGSIMINASRKIFARLNTDGSVDNSFNLSEGDYKVNCCVLQPDGKIVVAGTFTTYNGVTANRVARLNADGSLDQTFNVGGGPDMDVVSVKLLSNGKILIAGWFTKCNGVARSHMARLNANGSLDNSFNPQIGTTSDKVGEINVQEDGKILVGGTFNTCGGVSRNYIARLNADGTLDNSFNVGTGLDMYLNSIALQPDGKILLGGRFNTYNGQAISEIVRLNTNGSVDNSFNPNGGIESSSSYISQCFLQPNGQILICGDFDTYGGVTSNGVARIIGDSPKDGFCSSLDLTFSEVSNIKCNKSGSAIALAYYGTAPYQYNWISVPGAIDSLANFNNKGVYTCSVIDAKGCSDTASLLISVPVFLSSFDIESNLVNSTFRKGFNSQLDINVINKGCVKTSGQLKLIKDNFLEYQTAIPLPNQIVGDTIIWNYSNLQSELGQFSPKIFFKTSLLANIGDSIRLTTIVTPFLNDIDISNNTRNYIFPVLNAYDPNDKKVYPAGDCPQGYIKDDQLLTYTVRFQNTGNAEAVNISVLDSLSSNLDISTLRVVASSDTCHIELPSINVAKFVFNNINLPDSSSNEPASHGYVIFEIMPKTGLSKNTEIQNNVGIYFDFNPPVITNTVLNTISDGTLSCSSGVGISGTDNPFVLLYPNPSNGLFVLESQQEIPQNISMYDKMGRNLFSIVPTSNISSIDLSEFASDMYFIQVKYVGSLEVVKAIVRN